jgi:DNA (cytosine-5)-methyltransferase 1
MESKVKNKKINYSIIRRTLFGDKTKQTPEYLAELSHFFQKNSEVNLNSATLTKILNGHAKELLSEPVFQTALDIVWDVPFPPPRNPDFTFIDLFAGIGGFRIALQNQNGKCVFSSEINNPARQTYETNFGEFPFGDIRQFTGQQISDEDLNRLIPDHTILTGGFPCQPFSLAGVSARNFLGQVHGFSDETKGNLFFDIARIVQVKKPKFIFLENVKNFRSHDDGNTYNTVKNTLEDLGYHFYSDVINAQTWVPQQRQRFYMVCIKRKRQTNSALSLNFRNRKENPKN